MPRLPRQRTPTPTSDEAKNRLLSTFGMCEMEVAARVIVKKASIAKSWRVPISRVVDFDPTDDLMQAGYHLLVAYGWLKPDARSGALYPTRGFVDRVRSTFIRDADPRTRMR